MTKTDLDIDISFHANRKDATDFMIADMIALTDYASIDEIVDEADAGLCGLSDDEAWADTSDHDRAQWKIIAIPSTL